MFKLLKGGHLFSPEDRGVQDVLICYDKIVRIGRDLSSLSRELNAEVIPADGKILAPGFIDQHVHFLGGGDNEGPGGATTDIAFSSLTGSGITTAVGCLGIDDDARNLIDLMRRAMDLDRLGIETYIYTGSFNMPSLTITGSVRRDVTMIDKVLGVKIAVAEVFATLSPLSELANSAKDSYLGGLISGKAGLTHVHVGKKPERLEPLFELVAMTGIPISRFVATHVNRSIPKTMEQAVRFATMGGNIDISCITSPETGSPTGIRADRALCEFLESGVPIEQITLSSDGNVSMPVLDDKGNKSSLFNAGTNHLHRMFLAVLKNCNIPFPNALKIVTSNVARVLSLEERKGSIGIGKDADIIVFDRDYQIHTLFARGRVMVQDGKAVVKSYFE